jgi:hypothetical protein
MSQVIEESSRYVADGKVITVVWMSSLPLLDDRLIQRSSRSNLVEIYKSNSFKAANRDDHTRSDDLLFITINLELLRSGMIGLGHLFSPLNESIDYDAESDLIKLHGFPYYVSERSTKT